MIPMRVSDVEEELGLDVSQHGESLDGEALAA
jgi:ammonia channel protein AmtB